jgi:hypothetical protein
MFHEVSLRSRFDDLEPHPLVERERRIDAQDPQAQRQPCASSFRRRRSISFEPIPRRWCSGRMKSCASRMQSCSLSTTWIPMAVFSSSMI